MSRAGRVVLLLAGMAAGARPLAGQAGGGVGRGVAPAAVAAGGASAPADSVPTWRVAQPERPTVATHAYPVAPGVVEIETGVQVLRPSGGSEADVPFVAKLGVARPLQVEVSWGWTRQRAAAGAPASALTDVAIAPKLRVLHDAPVLANFSVQPSLKLPAGRKGLSGTGTTDVGLLLISSRTLGRLSLDLNAGATWRSGAGRSAPRTATLLTASTGLDLGHGLVWDTELFDLPGTSGPAGARPQVGLLTGPTLAVRPWLVLDVGVIADLAGLPANSGYAGITWNIGRIAGWPGAR